MKLYRIEPFQVIGHYTVYRRMFRPKHSHPYLVADNQLKQVVAEFTTLNEALQWATEHQ